MKIKEGFILRQVANTNIIVPVGEKALTFKDMISLNETGAVMWQMMQEDITKEKIIENMLSKYDISKEVVEKDVQEFIEQLQRIDALV